MVTPPVVEPGSEHLSNNAPQPPKRRAPKHRGAPKHAHIARAPRTAARNVIVLSSVAVAVTGASVVAGLAGQQAAPAAAGAGSADLDAIANVGAATAAEGATERREPVISRDDLRPEAVPAKSAGLDGSRTAAITDSRELSDSDPRDIARALLGEFGFSSSQFGCLDSLWTRESNWRWNADNPTSSAYGIPQALPGSKMSTAGADWATNPATQIRWGLGYIKGRYGSPCSAWGHSQARGWY